MLVFLIKYFLAGSSLIHSNVKPVIRGICTSCIFTNDSNAKGCAITLLNDQFTFNFTIPRHSSYDIASLECFKVWQSGSYHVLVSEILMDGSEGYNTLELPDITIALPSGNDNSAKQANGRLLTSKFEIIDALCIIGTPIVNGLSAVLGLTRMGLFIAVLLAVIFFLKRGLATKRNKNGRRHQFPNLEWSVC